MNTHPYSLESLTPSFVGMEEESNMICEPQYPQSNDKLMEIVDLLGDRLSFSIRKRFGLDDGTARTLREVADMYGITPEPARQAEAKALRKLRQSPHMDVLVELAEEHGIILD